jgi:hypothetical protein
MHEDYQLAYYPIVHITSLTFADNAFERTRLTPELLYKLHVPSQLHASHLPFKKNMWNTPICRTTVQTVSGVHTHSTRPMLYRTANDALKLLGEIAGYFHLIHYCCFRSWVVNEANCKLKYAPISRLRQAQGSIIHVPPHLSQPNS